MSRLPKARTDDVVAIAVAGEMVVQNPTGDEIARLDARTAAVWRLADGATSVADIAAALATEREAVWACLDRLSDWGLLEARVTPPAGARPLSRRGVLETAAGGAGWLGLQDPRPGRRTGPEALGAVGAGGPRAAGKEGPPPGRRAALQTLRRGRHRGRSQTTRARRPGRAKETRGRGHAVRRRGSAQAREAAAIGAARRPV